MKFPSVKELSKRHRDFLAEPRVIDGQRFVGIQEAARLSGYSKSYLRGAVQYTPGDNRVLEEERTRMRFIRLPRYAEDQCAPLYFDESRLPHKVPPGPVSDIKLTEDQIRSVDLWVREYGAANLTVASRRNRASVTVGFRCWRRTGYRMNKCFNLPYETSEADLKGYEQAIERHLDARMLGGDFDAT